MKQSTNSNHQLRFAIAFALLLFATVLAGCDRTNEELMRLSGEADQVLREAREKAGLTGEKQWYSPTTEQATLPLFIGDTGGQGPRDFVGLLQSRDTKQWFSVVVFNGLDLSTRWEAGPYKVEQSDDLRRLRRMDPGSSGWRYDRVGQRVDLRRRPLLAVSQGNIVVAPSRESLHLLKGRDGAEIRKVQVDSKVRALCASPGPEHFVFVDLESTRHLRFDSTSGATTKLERPEWCPEREPLPTSSSSSSCHPLYGAASCRATLDDGFDTSLVENSYYVELGDRGVALGKKLWSDPYNSSIVGYSISENAILWQRRFEEHRVIRTALTEDRVLLLLDTTGGTLQMRLAALDLTSGRELWNSELPWATSPVVGPIVVSDGRVFLVRDGWLDVLDATSGQTVGFVGVTP
jgi:hypothetical protein